jgi:hypothetical protein
VRGKRAGEESSNVELGVHGGGAYQAAHKDCWGVKAIIGDDWTDAI